MKLVNVSNFNFSSVRTNFYGANPLTSKKTPASLINLIRKSVNAFAKHIEDRVPSCSIYGFNGIAHLINGVDSLTSYSAMFELRTPLNNPDPKYNTIKRLTLNVFEKNNPENVVNRLLIKGTKEDIVNYLRKKDTPAKIKSFIEKDISSLPVDIY